MKLAKKILSVVLAVVLALGAFAVVGSANGNPDTAEYQVKMWLTGTIGTAEWTTNSKVVTDLGDESDPGATIEVQPGDTVFVKFYATNNYYVNIIQTNIFFSSALRDATEVYAEQRGRAMTAANLKKIQMWNEAHPFVDLATTSYATVNVWGLMADTFKANYDQNWPTDNDGNMIYNTADWKFAIFGNLANETNAETCILEDEETEMFVLPVTVPDDAAPGTTYTVTIPEGIIQRTEKKYGALRLSEIGICEGEDAPCEMVDANAMRNPNMAYGDENQYYDLSEATLTLVVPGASTPTVDTAELEAKMQEAGNMVASGNYTTASVAALNEALVQGSDALESTDQSVIDAAVAALTEAITNAQAKSSLAALAAQISRYEELTAADWDDTSWATATSAYNAALAITTDDAQSVVDAATAALKEALDNLVAALDYSALADKVAEADGLVLDAYTEESIAKLNTAKAAAKAMLEGETAADQAAINAMVDALDLAIKGLDVKGADYTALNKAKDDFVALNAAEWTNDSYALAQAAYNEALAVASNLKYDDQGIVDAAAQKLANAIADLVPAGEADYDALIAAIDEYEGLTEAHYTDDTWAAAKAAYDAAKAVAPNLTGNDQGIIDAAADALVEALGKLVDADADYSAVEAAKAAAIAKVNEKDEGILRYTDDSIAAVTAAINEVVTGLKAKYQATVDGFATAINNAAAAVEYRPYDYTVINEAIADWNEMAEIDYKAATWAAMEAAVEGLVMNYTHEQYAAAKLQQINFMKAYNGLVLADPADYSAVDAAVDAYEALNEDDWTPETWAALEEAVANVAYGLNENRQTEVDGYADAINKAIEDLEELVIEYANYDALEAKVAEAKALVEADYTSTSWASFAPVLADAEAMLEAAPLLKAEQNKVDAKTQALAEAMNMLIEKADYSALEAILAEVDALNEKKYTEDSWAILAQRVAFGEELDKDLPATSQTYIDNAVADIRSAINDLDLKPVLSKITEITYEKSYDTHNTFTVTVEGRPAMIQFIEPEGGTRTYDRYNKNVTIVSYNEAGEEVNTLDRNVAYEVWNIYTNLTGPDVKVRAKYLEGQSYIWDTEKYEFTLELLVDEPNYDVRFIAPAALSGKKGPVETVVVVGPDAQAIRFVMPDGSTTTYSAAKATVLDNGDLQFIGKAWMNRPGLNVVNVQVKYKGVWSTIGTVEYTVE